MSRDPAAGTPQGQCVALQLPQTLYDSADIGNKSRANYFFIAAWLCLAFAEHSASRAEGHSSQHQQYQKQAIGYLQAGNTKAAAEIATKILDACAIDPANATDKNKFTAGNPLRIALLLLAVEIDTATGDIDRAITTSQTIVADSPPGFPDRLHAEAFLLQFKISRREEYQSDAIALLARTSQLPVINRPLRDQCQNIVFDAIINRYLANNISPGELAKEIADVETQMIVAGVPVGVARLSRFAAAMNHRRHSREEMLSDSLQDLRLIAFDPEVTLYRRAQYWNLSASLQINRRQYAEAFDSCRQFETCCLEAKLDDQLAISHDQSALVLLLIGDYAEARKVLESTRNYHTSPRRQVGESERLVRLENATTWRVNLAKAMEGNNEFLAARALLTEAARSLVKDQSTLPRMVALVNNNLALNHYLTGDFSIASKLIGEVCEATENVPGQDESHGAALVNSAWISLAHDNTQSAAESFAAAADFFASKLTQAHPRFAETLTYQARVAAIRGDFKNATKWIKQAETLVYDRVCRDLNAAPSARDRIALVQEARVHPESIAWPGTIDTYLELAPSLSIPATQQYDVVLRWKGVLQRYDRLAALRLAQHGEKEHEIQANLREAYFRKVSLLKRRELQQEIDQLESRLRELQRRARSETSDENVAETPSADDVAAKLKQGDLFLDVFQIRTFHTPTRQTVIGSSSEYLAFAVQADGQVNRLSLGSADILDEAVIRWVNTITEQRTQIPAEEHDDHLRRLNDTASRVATLVQSPILDSANSLRRVLIRSDGATHLIPWTALPGTDGKKYWIENVSIQISNSTAFEELPTRSKDRPSLLVIGGVEYGELTMYPALPGSVNEQRQISQMFEKRFGRESLVELTGSAATEAALLSSMPGKEFVHLATHGFYHRRDESKTFGVPGATTLLQTGLVVAPPGESQSQRDQYLTAAEIGEIDLSNSSLVMLSACESSLGKTVAGQGVHGMLNSFHAAGAERVIGTLWVVDDAATAFISEQFYQHLWEQNQNPVDALRATQLEMIHTVATNPNAALLSHPYAWAAFICSAK